MIGTCQKCGNTGWDKKVSGDKIICPKCGCTWNFIKLPLFIITGANGVGKTTTALELQRMTQDFIVLDSDMLYNIMPHKTEGDFIDQLEQMEYFSRNMMQCGKPVVWTRAGSLDKIPQTYGKQFFSRIECLALVCSEEELRRRMQQGRGIIDSEWIQGSVDYNHYFMEHEAIGDMGYEIINIDKLSIRDAALEVERWLKNKLLEQS